MSRRPLCILATVAVAGLLGLAACENQVPTAADAGEAGTVADHAGHGPTLDALLTTETRPEVRAQIQELGRVTARYHNIKQAVADGYDSNVGCLDETLAGVDPSTARGMGYHVTKSAGIIDANLNFLEPEFLVYTPHNQDASLPEDQRVGRAKLIGVEYFIPSGLWTEPDPPELFGDPFDYNAIFDAWVRHIYLWKVNPEGLYENWNAAVPLCTQLLGAEPIG